MSSDFGYSKAKRLAFEVASTAKAHGFTDRDLFVALAAIVGSQNLNLARKSLEALEKVVSKGGSAEQQEAHH